jgi:predicted CopG family antitoxin
LEAILKLFIMSQETNDSKIVEITNEIFEILKGLTLKEFSEVLRRLQNKVSDTIKIL